MNNVGLPEQGLYTNIPVIEVPSPNLPQEKPEAFIEVAGPTNEQLF